MSDYYYDKTKAHDIQPIGPYCNKCMKLITTNEINNHKCSKRSNKMKKENVVDVTGQEWVLSEKDMIYFLDCTDKIMERKTKNKAFGILSYRMWKRLYLNNGIPLDINVSIKQKSPLIMSLVEVK